MTLKQYQSFIAVANHGSFSEAAEQTGISQPTLSRLIKQLEDELQVELIDRYHRPLQLTNVGDFFYKNLKTLLNELDTLTALTKKMGKPSPTLTIGFVPSVLYGLLPDVIELLKQQYPDLEVQLKDISSYQQIEALKSGDIDVGLGRFAFNNKQTQQVLLRNEPYVAALPIKHTLANKEVIQLNDLISETLILYHQTYLPKTTKNGVTEPLLHIFNEVGLKPHKTTQVRDLQIALGLVAAFEGVTLVPESLKTERTDKIVYKTIQQKNATTPIYLHTLADLYHPAVEQFLNVIYDIYEIRKINYLGRSLN